MRRTVLLGVIAVVLAGVFVRLGLWQLDRAGQRERANDEIAARMARPPLSLSGAPGATAAQGLAWRRVQAAGTWAEDERIVPGRTWRGTPGVDVLTPLELPDGGVLWVNRGWLPSPDAATVDARPWRAVGHARVSGWLRPATSTERELGSAALVLQPAPQPGGGLPRRRDPPELSKGPHLSYALQWFAFAAIALVGGGAYAWARLRGRGGGSAPDPAAPGAPGRPAQERPGAADVEARR